MQSAQMIRFPYFSVNSKTDRLLDTPNLNHVVMTFCVRGIFFVRSSFLCCYATKSN